MEKAIPLSELGNHNNQNHSLFGFLSQKVGEKGEIIELYGNKFISNGNELFLIKKEIGNYYIVKTQDNCEGVIDKEFNIYFVGIIWKSIELIPFLGNDTNDKKIYAKVIDKDNRMGIIDIEGGIYFGGIKYKYIQIITLNDNILGKVIYHGNASTRGVVNLDGNSLATMNLIANMSVFLSDGNIVVEFEKQSGEKIKTFI